MSKRKKVKKPKTLVYYGPSIPGALQQYAVFINGLPKHVEDKLEKYTILKSLFVAVGKLTETRTNLKIKGTKERRLYEKAKETLGGSK